MAAWDAEATFRRLRLGLLCRKHVEHHHDGIFGVDSHLLGSVAEHICRGGDSSNPVADRCAAQHLERPRLQTLAAELQTRLAALQRLTVLAVEE